MPVPVRRYLRRSAPKRPPIKIKEAPKPRRTFPAEYRMDAFEAMEKWQEWQGWTLAPGMVHGGRGARRPSTYVKRYPTGFRGVLMDVYVVANDKHEYTWGILDSGGKVIRAGEAADLWAARTKADNVYMSLPYVAGWNAALKGRKMRQGKNEEWTKGYRAAKALLARVTGGGSAPVFDPDAEIELGE